MVGVFQRALGALLLAVLLGLALSAPARAEQPVSRCVLASDQALTLDQARRTPGWNCQPGPRDFAHEHLWVRLGLPPGRASEPQVLTSDALAFSAIDVVVSLSDGRERRAHYTADQVARHWTLGTNFALPLLDKGEQATAVWLRVAGAIDRNNTFMATVVPARADADAREQGLVLFALFCGMLLIVAVYALALSVALKSPFSLWHGAMVAFLLLYTLSSSSLLHMALPGLGMWGRSATSYLSLSFSMAMMGPLLVTFLERGALPRWAVRQAYGASIIAGMAGVLFVTVGPLFPFVSRPLYHVAFIPAVPCFAMLCVVAWRRGSRAIGVVAHFPQTAAVFLRPRPDKAPAAEIGGNRAKAFGLFGHPMRRAVEFDHQLRRKRQRRAGIGVAGGDGFRIEKLDPRHGQAGLNGGNHAIHRRAHVGKGAGGRRYRLGLAMQAQRQFGDQPQRALGPDE